MRMLGLSVISTYTEIYSTLWSNPGGITGASYSDHVRDEMNVRSRFNLLEVEKESGTCHESKQRIYIIEPILGALVIRLCRMTRHTVLS